MALLIHRSTAPGRSRASRRRAMLFWGPFLAATIVTQFIFWLDRAIAGVIGALLIFAMIRKPGSALRVLVLVLPFSYLGLALLYRWGFPAELVRPMSFWKEAMVGVVVAAGIRTAIVEDHRPDALDKFALAYIGLGTVLLFLPAMLIEGPGAQLAFGTRVNGFRLDVAYVLLFLGARHARMPADAVARVARAFIGAAVVVGALGIFEFLFPSMWNTIVIEWIRLPDYKIDILGANPFTDLYLYDVHYASNAEPGGLLRIGGVVIDRLHLPFLLCIAVALLVEQQVRRSGAVLRSAALPLTAVPVLLTLTRSGVLALAGILCLVLFRQAGRTTAGRIRFALLGGALALIAIPVGLAAGLDDRFEAEDTQGNTSGELHAESSATGFRALIDEPMGRGLATSAGAGQRDDVNDVLVTENQLLQIGTQLGVLGLALWVGTYALTLRRLGAAVREVEARDDTERTAVAIAAGARVCLLAFVPAMMFLQIFIYFPMAWILWGIAGAGLGCLEGALARDRAPVRL